MEQCLWVGFIFMLIEQSLINGGVSVLQHGKNVNYMPLHFFLASRYDYSINNRDDT